MNNSRNSLANVASLAVFLSSALWGLYWVPLRHFDEQGIEGGWATALMNVPPGLALLAVTLWQFKQHRGHFIRIMLIGTFTGLGVALYTSGLVYSSVVRATMLFYIMPVWGTLIGIFWLGEQTNWQRWAAIVIGLLGLMLLVSGGGPVPLNIGDLFAFLSSISWAIGAAMIKRYESVPVAGMTMFQFFVVAIAAVGLGYMVDLDVPPATDVVVSQLPLALLFTLIVLPSVWVVFWAQKILFPGRVGLLMMSEVLTAVITASIFLPEESMSVVEWAGAALIIGSCLLEVMSSSEDQGAIPQSS